MNEERKPVDSMDIIMEFVDLADARMSGLHAIVAFLYFFTEQSDAPVHIKELSQNILEAIPKESAKEIRNYRDQLFDKIREYIEIEKDKKGSISQAPYIDPQSNEERT